MAHKSTSQGGLYGNYCYFHAELNISGLRQKFDWLIIGRDKEMQRMTHKYDSWMTTFLAPPRLLD